MIDLLNKACKYFATHPWPGSNDFLIQLRSLQQIEHTQIGLVEWKRPVACTYLTDTLNTQNSITLVHELAKIMAKLTWRDAPKGELTASMDDSHAMCEIVGPDTSVPSDQLRFGAFLLAPHTLYPLHKHGAEEVYLLLSGDGKWKLQDHDFVKYPPGSIIHINPWVSHAIQSREEPLLMLWAWYGDIDFTSYELEEL